MASLSTDDALQSRIVAIEKALHLGLKGEATSQLTSCVEAIEGALKNNSILSPSILGTKKNLLHHST